MLLFHRAGPGAALEGYTWELTIYAIPIRHKINQIDALKVNLVPNICVVYLKKKKHSFHPECRTPFAHAITA